MSKDSGSSSFEVGAPPLLSSGQAPAWSAHGPRRATPSLWNSSGFASNFFAVQGMMETTTMSSLLDPQCAGEHSLESAPNICCGERQDGEMGQQLRVVLLDEFHPGRAAGGELRHTLRLLASRLMNSLLSSMTVRSAVKDVSNTRSKPMARSAAAIWPVVVDARLKAEHLTQGHAHGRRDLGHDHLLGSWSAFHTSSTSELRRKGAGRADAGALAAVDALHLAQVLAEDGHHRGLGPAVGEIDGSDRSGSRSRSGRSRRTGRTCSGRARGKARMRRSTFVQSAP